MLLGFILIISLATAIAIRDLHGKHIVLLEQIKKISKQARLLAGRLGTQSSDVVEVSQPADKEALNTKLDSILEYLKVSDYTINFGNRISGSFVAFMDGIEEEIRILNDREITGPEYYRRAHALLFSLMMAQVYVKVNKLERFSSKVDTYLERANKLI